MPELFHEGFDDQDVGTELFEAGSDAGVIESDTVRWGSHAYRIALSETQGYHLLRSVAIDDQSAFWMGWSTLHEGPDITYGTELFAIECVTSAAPDPYMEDILFTLNMNPETPNVPYFAYGTIDDILDDAQGGGTPGFDNLDTVEDDNAFSDWAVHMYLSESDDGFLELYRNGTLLYSVSGPTRPAACLNDKFHVEWTLYRWQDMPPAQSLVLDEITLIRGPEAPLTDADALYTLIPESDCFAN